MTEFKVVDKIQQQINALTKTVVDNTQLNTTVLDLATLKGVGKYIGPTKTFTAGSTISKGLCVRLKDTFTQPNGAIILRIEVFPSGSSPNSDQNSGLIGIALNDAVEGESVPVAVSGCITTCIFEIGSVSNLVIGSWARATGLTTAGRVSTINSSSSDNFAGIYLESINSIANGQEVLVLVQTSRDQG